MSKLPGQSEGNLVCTVGEPGNYLACPDAALQAALAVSLKMLLPIMGDQIFTH